MFIRFYTAFCPRGRDIDIIFGEHERRYNEMIKRVHEKNMEAGMYNDSIQMMEKVIKLLDRPTCVSEMLKIERFRNNVFEEKATWEECVEMLDWLDAIVRRPCGDMDVDLRERNIKLYCKRLWEIYEAACQQFYNKRSNSLMLLQEMVQKEGVQFLRFRFNKSVTSGLPKTTVWLCGYIQKVYFYVVFF